MFVPSMTYAGTSALTVAAGTNGGMAGDEAGLRDEAEKCLRALAGEHARLREDQWTAISALVADGRRALVVQRTGWGKSAVYFVATALLRARGAGPTVIVSPLLALMRNQVEAAERAGIHARTINSANIEEWEALYAEVAAGAVDVLLVSPERLNNPAFRDQVLPELTPDGRAGRDRRGALHLRLGPRLPARLPAAPHAARPSCRRTSRCWPPPRPPTPGSPGTSPSSSAPAAGARRWCCAARWTGSRCGWRW